MSIFIDIENIHRSVGSFNVEDTVNVLTLAERNRQYQGWTSFEATDIMSSFLGAFSFGDASSVMSDEHLMPEIDSTVQPPATPEPSLEWKINHFLNSIGPIRWLLELGNPPSTTSTGTASFAYETPPMPEATPYQPTLAEQILQLLYQPFIHLSQLVKMRPASTSEPLRETIH